MRKLLSLVLVVCMLVSAFGTVTAFGATASGGGGGSSSVIPSTPSVGGGGSAGGGGGGSASGGGGGGGSPARLTLFGDDCVYDNGTYYPGDLNLECHVMGVETEYDVYAVLAQYDDSGALVRMDMQKKRISLYDNFIYASLDAVDASGKIKAMALRADNFMPLCPANEYVAETSTIDNVGLIMDSYKSTMGFEPQWQIKLLTKDGVSVYCIDTICIIDGKECNMSWNSASQDMLGFEKYVNGTSNVYSRAIAYETNSSGEIDNISFLNNKTNTQSYAISSETYVKFNNKLGSRSLWDKLSVFNVMASKVDNATAEDVSALVDGNSYSGVLIDMNGDDIMEFFIATEGEFATEGDEPSDEPEEEPDDNKLIVPINMFTDGEICTVIDGVDEFGNPVQYYNWNTELNYYASKDATRDTSIYIAENPTIRINGAIVGNVTNLRDSYFTNVIPGSIENANRKTLVTFTENDNDKYYDVIDIQVLNYAIVESVLVNKSRIEFVNGSKMIFDFEDEEQESYFYNAEGAEIAFEDIAEGDVLAIEIGEMDSTTNRPVNYNVFEKKATIYDLGKNMVTGTVTGWDHDTTDNTGIIYIDGQEYDYNANSLWVTDSTYSDLVATGDPLGVSGVFYLGMNGEIIGWEGAPIDYSDYGFIIQTHWNTTGFEPNYQIMMLTNEGIVTYDVDTTCEINIDANPTNWSLDYTYVASNPQYGEYLQSTVLGANNLDVKFNKSVHNVVDRFVEFETNKSGEIDEISFLYNMTSVFNYEISANTEYRVATNKLGTRLLETEGMVFDVSPADVRNAKTYDYSVLIDRSEYAGYVFDLDNDRECEFFVMTDGAVAVEPEAEPEAEFEEGFIIQSYWSTIGFDAKYQLMVLTADEGVKIFDVGTTCEIDDVEYDTTGYGVSQYTVLGSLETKFDKTCDNASDRFVSYSVNKNGEIDKMYFVKNMATSNCLMISYDTIYDAATGMLGTASLSEDISIFNAAVSDIEESTSEDISVLMDGNSYGGTVIDMDNDGKMDYFVVLYGELLIPNEEPSGESEYGFIIKSHWNTTSFEPNYQLMVLTADEDIKIFDVDTTCEIDDVEYASTGYGTSQYSVLSSLETKFDKCYHNASDRFVSYSVNKNGEIDKMHFVKNMATADGYSVSYNTEYLPDAGKLGSRLLDDDLVVFDLKNADINKAKVSDISALVKRGAYEGHLFDIDKDGKMDFFFMTEGYASFDPEANLLVVDSVTKTTYGEDAEEAVMIKYYTEGTNELLQAVFTEDSVNVLSATVDAYKNLAKGSVLVANVDKNGLVSMYGVIANVYGSTYGGLYGSLNNLTVYIYGTNEVSTRKQDKTEFIYGYISDIKGKRLTLGGTVANDFADGRDFVIDSTVAQYCYSTETPKANIVVGDYAAKGVDVFTAAVGTTPAKANLVLLKVYDDEVTDIISFSNREVLANGAADLGIIAQTHYTGPGLDLN